MVGDRIVRWGIVGAGNIAHRFARALARERGSELSCVSCRRRERAEAFAAEHGSPRACWDDRGEGSGHIALLSDPSIDAVYVALPHGLHLRWVEEALRAGKAVLCEKPLALTAEEARRMAAVSLATGSLLMEAMKSRFEPAYREVARLVAQGAVGDVARVEASLCNEFTDEALERSSYYLDPVQGGCLLDTGIYCASWIEDYLPAPVSVTAARMDMGRGVDVHVDAELSSAAGVEGRLVCACDRAGSRAAVITGTRGTITVENQHRPDAYVIEAEGAPARRVEVPYEVDDFYPEVAHFADLVRRGAEESPVMPLAASIRCAGILDAVRAAARAR